MNEYRQYLSLLLNWYSNLKKTWKFEYSTQDNFRGLQTLSESKRKEEANKVHVSIFKLLKKTKFCNRTDIPSIAEIIKFMKRHNMNYYSLCGMDDIFLAYQKSKMTDNIELSEKTTNIYRFVRRVWRNIFTVAENFFALDLFIKKFVKEPKIVNYFSFMRERTKDNKSFELPTLEFINNNLCDDIPANLPKQLQTNYIKYMRFYGIITMKVS